MKASEGLFEFGEWDEVGIPPRSGLFRPEPYGLGTANQESLLSYLMRASYAHGVNPRLLVKYVLAEQNPRIGQIATKAFFQTLSGTMNGLGLYAEMFADVLESVTVRQDLRQLTMLRWKGLLPHNGQGLLARRPRWCPACLHERGPGVAGTPVPLVWSLEPYQVCLDRRVRLEDRCHVCDAKQDFLPSFPDPGYCRRCRSWLGHETESQDLSNFQSWVSRALADMIATASSLSAEPDLDVFRKFLVEQIARHTDGNRTAFCRAIGLGDFAVSGWLNKGQRPSVTQFLTVCHGVQVLPTGIFREGHVENEVVGVRKPNLTLRGRRQSPHPTYEQRQVWRQLLEAELASNSPRPVSVVAKSFGVTPSCLRYWFPSLCKTLSIRSRRAARARSLSWRLQEIAMLRETVAEVHRSGLTVSRRLIDKALRERGLTVSRLHLRQVLRKMVGALKSEASE